MGVLTFAADRETASLDVLLLSILQILDDPLTDSTPQIQDQKIAENLPPF